MQRSTQANYCRSEYETVYTGVNDVKFRHGIETGQNNYLFENIATIPSVGAGNIMRFKHNTGDVEIYNILKCDEIQEVTGSSGVTIDDVIVESNSIKDIVKTLSCAGRVSGGNITDHLDGTITVSNCICYFRTVNGDSASLIRYTVNGLTTIPLTDQSDNYVVCNYNGGTPIMQILTSSATIYGNENTLFELYEIYRDGTTLNIVDHHQKSANVGRHLQTFIYDRFKHTRTSGLILGETGTRNIIVSAGRIYVKLVINDISAIDTSISDTFVRYYYNGSSWISQTGQSQWDNVNYNNIASGLVTMTNGRYSFQEFFITADGKLYSMYSDAQYITLASVESAPVLTFRPPIISTDHMTYIGRIVFQKNDVTAQSILNPFDILLNYSSATDHGNLTGLSDDDHIQYYNDTRLTNGTLTEIEFADTQSKTDKLNFNTNWHMGPDSINDLQIQTDNDTKKINLKFGTINRLAISESGVDCNMNNPNGAIIIDGGAANNNVNISNCNRITFQNENLLDKLILKTTGGHQMGVNVNWFEFRQDVGQNGFRWRYGTGDIMKIDNTGLLTLTGTMTSNGLTILNNGDLNMGAADDIIMSSTGELKTNKISEAVADNGILIDNTKIKDGIITPLSTDTGTYIQSVSSDFDIYATADINLKPTGGLQMNLDGTNMTCNGDIYFPDIVADAIGNTAMYINTTDGQIGIQSSTRKTKKNIEDITDFNKLLQLKPRKFNYRKREKSKDGVKYLNECYDETQYGLIYDECEGIMDEILVKDRDGNPLTLQYNKLICPLLKLVQNQQKEIDNLKEKINTIMKLIEK
jgi:hypothetical protein